MQLELSAEQVSALMSRMPAGAVGINSSFSYADGLLTVPDDWEAQAQAIIAEPGWEGSASRDALLRYASDRRWHLETGGISVAGVPVLTDDRSKLMIAGARLAAMADPDWTTPWHGADGGIYPLDAAAIVAISDAVSAHVQASFTTFATVKAAIAGGTITTTAEVDAAFA